MSEELNPNDAPDGYIAVESAGCAGCAFVPDDERCMSASCGAMVRDDGRYVIFVKRPDPAPAVAAPEPTHEVSPVAWVHVPRGAPIFASTMTRIEIDDEAAGEFVIVSQPASEHEGAGSIRIDASEWPSLRAAIDAAVRACRG